MGGQRRRHPVGDRARPAAERDVASCVVDRRRGRLPRRVHRGRLRCGSEPADAVSPHEVRGRAARPHRAGPALSQSKLPSFTPIMLPDSGRTNIVPVDYVVDAMVWLMHVADRDGQTFHLTSPEPIGLQGIYRGVAIPALTVRGPAKVVRNAVATQLCIPAELLDVADLSTTFNADGTQEALQGSGITVPGFASSSRARPAGSAARRRSRSRSGARRYSRWRATDKRWTNWSRRSASPAVRHTPSPATSPIHRRWSTPSKRSSAGSATSTIW